MVEQISIACVIRFKVWLIELFSIVINLMRRGVQISADGDANSVENKSINHFSLRPPHSGGKPFIYSKYGLFIFTFLVEGSPSDESTRNVA